MTRSLSLLSILSFSLLGGFFMFSSGPKGVSHTVAAPPKVSINITLTSDSVKPVSPLMYGFTTDNLFDEIDNPYDTSFLKLVTQIGPHVIRWPGGSGSNFTHGMENGYGYMKSQIAGINVKTAQKYADQGRFDRQTRVDHSYIEDLVRLAKATNSKVLLVANILTGSSDECIEEINYLKEYGVEIAGVELGHELYFPSVRSSFPFPGSYINKASQFAVSIRKLFPDIKLGVCAAPYGKTGDGGIPNSIEQTFFKSWNDALARNKFYDAVVIHYYNPITVKKEVSLDSVFTVAVHDLQKMYMPSGLASLAMDYYNLTFPKTKIWLTEWNIANTATQGYYLNTLYQSIYIHSFIHYLNRFNAQNDNAIEIATFVSLATAGKVGNHGIIGVRGEKEKLNSVFVKRTAYYAFLNLKELYNSAAAPMMVETSNVPAKTGIFAYRDTTSKTLWLYWYNISGQEESIGQLVVDNDTINNTSIITVNKSSGPLYSSYGFTRFARSNTNIPPFEETKTMMLSDFVMPANGYGYCKLDSTVVN